MAREDSALFFHRVGDLLRRAPVTCALDTTILEAARRLTREGVGSVIVVDAEDAPRGIVTDRDLRGKVLAQGRDPAATRVHEVMSSPLVSISPSTFAFEALLEMTRREIHHLAVVEADRLVGVLSSHDVLRLHATHPVMLAREIGRAPSLGALAALGGRITDLARRLLAEGGRAHDIGQIISELNDRIVMRVLGLAAGALEEQGEDAPDVPYAWLSFGSEARREQVLRTDQDNGLVYGDPPAHLAERAAAYYTRLGQAVVQGLVEVGFPPCPGGIVASNPRWCQPLGVWMAHFRRLLDDPTVDQVLGACIHFDLRPLLGAPELGAALRELLAREAPSRRRMLALLARDVVERRVALTIFGGIRVRRSEPRRGAVDVKSAGTMQVAGAARLHALELGLAETNTVERFRAAGARGLYGDGDVREITDAYQLLLRIRLAHQLDQLANGRPPDNHVSPAGLTHADRVLFREALRSVQRLQSRLRERFATDFLGS